MKIGSSSIGFGSQQAGSISVAIDESLHAWVGAQRPDFEGRIAQRRSAAELTVAISDAARRAAAPGVRAGAPVAPDAASTSAIEDGTDQASGDAKIQLLVSLVESLTGQKIKLFHLNEMTHVDQAPSQPPQGGAGISPAVRQGWGVEYDRHETIRESQYTSFAAEGDIRTSDGRVVQFTLSIEMKREFFQETNVSVREGDGVSKDPLVINFGGTAAQLTATRFSFDLDSDGRDEAMPFVGNSSGFLALDKDGNGVINNGLELFGTRSGNGFADLSAYDSDNNHWIDEQDPVFSRLMVWSKDAGGKDDISTLAQRRVGALYLGNIATPFDLKDGKNTLQGQVRGSGIYLGEDGSVGSLQQIDLVV